MAEKRMFSKQIIDSDAFLEMPLSTQALYFHLGMRADDDGFIDNPKKIQRTINASEDDMKILLSKRYILKFESGVIVIKHWRIHNTLRSDRYNETVYQEEKSMLELKDNKSYTERKDLNVLGIPNGNQMATMAPQNSIEKNSIDNVSKEKRAHFVPPSFEEVQAYCIERKNNVDPQKFFDYFNTPDTQGKSWYDSKGNKVRNWKQKVITWEKHSEPDGTKNFQPKVNRFNDYPQRKYTAQDYEEIERKLLNKGL
jgi:hypothetical protein